MHAAKAAGAYNERKLHPRAAERHRKAFGGESVEGRGLPAGNVPHSPYPSASLRDLAQGEGAKALR